MENAAQADAADAVGASAGAAGPVWRFLIQPRWLGWHLLMVLCFWGMLWLGDWQLHRALSGNGLSWAYTFEWPLFSGFAVVFWAKTIRDEFKIKRGEAVPGSALTPGLGDADLPLSAPGRAGRPGRAARGARRRGARRLQRLPGPAELRGQPARQVARMAELAVKLLATIGRRTP